MLNNEDYVKIFHEMKNSVTIINSYLQLLEKKYPEIATCYYWEDSVSEVEHLRSMVMELSQIRPNYNLHLSPVNLEDLLSQCCNTCQCFSSESGAECVLTLSQTPFILQMDSMQMRHAITNLLKNSYEAMGQQGQVHVDAALEDQEAVIHITDYGSGIAPDLLDKIFMPFITTKQTGTGLGLCITKQIIEAHNGAISVESKLAHGTTFTITLPINPQI